MGIQALEGTETVGEGGNDVTEGVAGLRAECKFGPYNNVGFLGLCCYLTYRANS